MSIDRHLIDILDIVANLLAALGLLFAAYDLCGRRYLQWLLRVLTPALVGALISMPTGIVAYATAGFTQLLGRGALIYGVTGVLIGVYNGLFVIWPVTPERPPIFSRRNAVIGGLLAFLGWSLASRSIEQDSLANLVEASLLALAGGGISGIWGFLNWELSSEQRKEARFSWRGLLLGAVLACVLGFLADFALGYGYSSTSLFQGVFLLPTGAILGAGWSVYKQTLETLLGPKASAKKNEAEANKLAEKDVAETGKSGGATSAKPPLFSWKGCLFGLVVACLFGLIWAISANITFSIVVLGNASRQELAEGIGGALLGMSLIGPGGAITGGFSRFIFWRVESLRDRQLAGFGAIVAALGILLQFVPPLLDYLNISIH